MALQDISPLAIVWLRFLMSVTLLGLAVVLRKQFSLPHKKEWGYFALLGFLGIFCSGLAYIAWYDALKALSTAQTGVFLYIEPLVAVVVAFFILGEAITAASLLGGAVILFGVWLVNRPGD